MAIRNLVPSFTTLAGSGDLAARWHEQVVRPHAPIYAAVTSWVDPADAAAALPGLVARGDSLLAAAERAARAVEQAAVLLRDAVPDAGPVDAVVLVGLGRANGWVAALDGTPTLFLAAEFLPAPGYDVVLALHELIHLVHRRRAARDWPADLMAADLFREGLAVHATSRLLPDVEPSGQLWFAPGAEEWIDRCDRSGLAARALADLDRTDVGSRWFGGRQDRPGELPGRCGYRLGERLVAGMDSPLPELLGRPLSEVVAELREALRNG